ncbi:hypothetical protein L195_g056450, partial [Trifolium pratense]
RAKVAEAEVQKAREELRRAEQHRQEVVQRPKKCAAEFQRQLLVLTNNIASIQAESSNRRCCRPKYDEDESNIKESEDH